MCRVYYSYCNFEKELKEMKETHICSMTKTNHRRNGEIWNMKNGNPLYYSFVECQWNYRDSIYCLPPAWHSFLLHCIFFSFLVAGLFTCLESISRFCIELIFKSVYDISLQKRKARWSRRRKRRKGKGRRERHKMHFIIRLSPIGRGEATQCRLI